MESKSSRRKLDGETMENFCTKMRNDGASLAEIVAAVEKKFGRPYTKQAASKAIQRALKKAIPPDDLLTDADVESLERERFALECRRAELTFIEIAVQVNKKYGTKIGDGGARRLVARAQARRAVEIVVEAGKLKERMIDRCLGAMQAVYPAVLAGDMNAVTKMLELDKRLCELTKIRLFDPRTLELAGEDGRPIQVENLTLKDRLSMLESLAGGEGPPAGGYVDRTDPQPS